MNKIYTKLIAIALALMLSVSVVVMSSYAWFTLSDSPMAQGISIAVGGGNTILIAADLTETVDGVTYHYPAGFSDKLNFGMHRSYRYLKDLGGLTPVSTVDGVNWFLPEYYDSTDVEVIEGRIPSGTLKDITEFTVDRYLEHTNLPKNDKESITQGHYIYLDFWVVSPGADYKLRLSTPTMEGDNSSGTFLVDLLQPAVNAQGDGYYLKQPSSEAAASARVGFLVNPNLILDGTMSIYEKSYGYDERYTRLRGSYLDKDSGYAYDNAGHFTIFEPNGDSHPEGHAEEGSYVHTRPLAMVNDVPTAVSIKDRVTVQKKSSWSMALNGESLDIEQRFQTALMGMKLNSMDLDQIRAEFYDQYLQGQISPYVTKGEFVSRTENLYAYDSMGKANAEQMEALDTAGATEDVFIIELERNVPQRIRMFIWLEGQDVDCVDSVNSSSFMLNIELAGGSE